VIHLLTLIIFCSNPVAVRRCEAQQLPTSAETQDKQVLGPFDLSNGLSGSRRQEMLREIRAFLWENLSKHRLAEVKATFYTLEGDPTKWTFTVTLSNDGRWCIRGEYVSKRYIGLKPGQQPETEKRTTDFCDVQRLDARTKVAIPQGEQRNPETYVLQLNKGRPDLNL
jgi:hypothetical protein